jgi:membrane carboxypeptidase/penicillin-binding protein
MVLQQQVLEYFDKSIKELNYEEAALLAALPKHQVNIILIEI